MFIFREGKDREKGQRVKGNEQRIMLNMSSLGKTLFFFGILLIIVGVIFMFGTKIPWFGRLPGDIYIQKKNFIFFFPITTAILISVIFSIILLLIRRR